LTRTTTSNFSPYFIKLRPESFPLRMLDSTFAMFSIITTNVEVVMSEIESVDPTTRSANGKGGNVHQGDLLVLAAGGSVWQGCISAWCCLLFTVTAHQDFPVGVEVRHPQPPGNSTLLTVTLCRHFTLTDNLWFTTVVKGGEAAVVSTGLEERRCHHMLQNTAIIWVKSHASSWRCSLHVCGHVRENLLDTWSG
jgi:hypothetical protein